MVFPLSLMFNLRAFVWGWINSCESGDLSATETSFLVNQWDTKDHRNSFLQLTRWQTGLRKRMGHGRKTPDLDLFHEQWKTAEQERYTGIQLYRDADFITVQLLTLNSPASQECCSTGCSVSFSAEQGPWLHSWSDGPSIKWFTLCT